MDVNLPKTEQWKCCGCDHVFDRVEGDPCPRRCPGCDEAHVFLSPPSLLTLLKDGRYA